MAGRKQNIVTWLGRRGAIGVRPSSVTAAAGAATLNAMSGTITTEALSTAGAAEYVLTLTNAYAKAGDHINWSVDMLASAGQGCACCATITNGQIVFVVSNVSSSAFDGPIAIKYNLIVKE